MSWNFYGRKIATVVDPFPRPEDIFAVQVRVVNLQDHNTCMYLPLSV